MNVAFLPVNNKEDIEKLSQLAHDIWFEYWPALIGTDQTQYMVDNFQSLEAINRDISQHNYEYWFIVASEGELDDTNLRLSLSNSNARIVGYTGGHDEPETNRFFISKIYLLKEERGKHFASRVIAFYEQLCKDRNFRAMYLTVNKHNDLGVRAYMGKGFETIDSVETDIGCGFIMDDFIMEKSV